MRKFYFLDESGDAEFFGKRGKKLWENSDWHPILIIGLLETENRKLLRQEVASFHSHILKDVYYEGICSLNKGEHFLHARIDHPDVRSAFFQFLRSRNDFKCYFSIVKKDPDIFISQFQKKTDKFYYNAVEQLLELPTFSFQDEHVFYLSKRNKTTSESFNLVIKAALNREMQQDNMQYSADIVKSSEYPELSIIDYMLWAVQRWVMKGELRFLKAVADKIVWIADERYIPEKGKGQKMTVEEFCAANTSTK